MTYSPLKITILQMRSLSTIWLKMSHFIRSVSDHVKCGIIVKLPTVGVHSCVFWNFSVVAIATGAKIFIKNRGKWSFCNFVWYLRAIYPQWTYLRASLCSLKTSLLYLWSIHANFIWLKYFGYEVQSFESYNTANAESIHNMALNESSIQISVRSWQMQYQI